MNFQAYCFKCEKRVTALSLLDETEFWMAIEQNADIEVMHTADDGDHRWRLNDYEKNILAHKAVYARSHTSGHVAQIHNAHAAIQPRAALERELNFRCGAIAPQMSASLATAYNTCGCCPKLV